jgi:hypothetical protein
MLASILSRTCCHASGNASSPAMATSMKATMSR